VGANDVIWFQVYVVLGFFPVVTKHLLSVIWSFLGFKDEKKRNVGESEKPWEKRDTILREELHIIVDLINALPGNCSENTIQHATIEEAVFSVYPTDAPIDWLDSDHVIYGCCRAMSFPRLYNESREL
jgi:hypothetical protein